MKLNEKIMNLRKKEGLSQEELAEKLNVTRQTVSKWELGTITPKIDKLTEMSRVFDITVEELISEEEIEEKETGNNPIVEDQAKKINENKTRKWPIIVVGIVLIMLIIILIWGCLTKFVFNSVLDKSKEGQKMVFDFFNSAVDKMQENQNSTINGQENAHNEMEEWYNSAVEKMEAKQEENYQKALNEQEEYMEQSKKQQQKATEEGLKASQKMLKNINK